MPDKTTIGNTNNNRTPSKAFREYIESLVEEVVLNGAMLNDHKKYLQRYSQEEGVDYATLEKSLLDFFEVMEEWNRLKSKSSERLATMLAKECYISESEMEKLFFPPREAREPNTMDGHEYVDLGLPSGTLWATCNIGASKPEDYGDYFAWGETRPKRDYGWSTYKYSSVGKLTKYTQEDSLTVLRPEDDAATANWGGGWCTPSKAQWDELLANTTNQWTTQNGKKGYLFASKNDQSLFLPAAGIRLDSKLYDAGSLGQYWSCSLYTGDPTGARSLYFYSDDHGTSIGFNRSGGFSVRPVREK